MEISKNTREIPVPLHLGYHEEKLDFVAKESLQDFNSLVAPQDKLDRFDKEEVSESEIMELIPQLEA